MSLKGKQLCLHSEHMEKVSLIRWSIWA